MVFYSIIICSITKPYLFLAEALEEARIQGGVPYPFTEQ